MKIVISVILSCVIIEFLVFFTYISFNLKRIPSQYDFEYRCNSKYLGESALNLTHGDKYVIDVCVDNKIENKIICRAWYKNNKNRYSYILSIHKSFSDFKLCWDCDIEYEELRKFKSPC